MFCCGAEAEVLYFFPQPEDKYSALLILIHIANSGRVYREMICANAGIDLIVQGVQAESHLPRRFILGTAPLFQPFLWGVMFIGNNAKES